MPSFILKGLEMVSLMALTGFYPKNHSPAWKAVNNIRISEADKDNSVLNGLLEIGMVVAGEDGKLASSLEAAMLMKILCSPSQVTGIRRMGLSGSTEYTLLKLGNLYCLYLAIEEQDLHICQFPLDEVSSKAWFEADILVPIPPDTSENEAGSYKVDLVGGALLNCIQDWYAKKAEAAVPIVEADMWFTGQEINDAFDEAAVSKQLEAIYTPEKIQAMLQDLKAADDRVKHLRIMTEAGLLQSRYLEGVEYFCYSAFMIKYMDPLRLRDILMIEKYFPKHQVSIVYLKDDGIFVMNSEEASVTFDAINADDLKQIIV